MTMFCSRIITFRRAAAPYSRSMSSSSNNNSNTGRNTISTSHNPFRILGVPPNSNFDTVQKAFVKLALQHHPDTGADNATPDSFVRIRHAFERIRDGDKNPSNSDNSDNDERGHHPADIDRADWTEDDFLDWFHDQTGQRVSPAQRRELIELHRSRVPGAVYQGSMWELARRLAHEQDAFLLKQQQQQQQNFGGRRASSFSSTSSRSTNHGNNANRNNSEKKQNANSTNGGGTSTIRRKRQR